MSKTNSLQAALNQNGSRKPQMEDVPPAPTMTVEAAKPSSRAGQSNISAYLHPDYQTSLRLIHARTGRKKQDLIAEALNDLFAKYDVPQIRES
jgi:hypothetical protein